MFKHNPLLFCAGFLVIFSLQVKSQTFGIKAGAVYNHFISTQQHAKGTPGIVAGVTYDHSLSDKLSLGTGLEYLQLGGNLLIFEDDTRYGIDYTEDLFATKIRDSKVTIHTINLPVLVNYQLISSANGGISLGIGPEVSYTLSASSKDVITSPLGGTGGIWATFTQTNNETDNYEAFNVAASLNLGFNFLAGESPMSINFRYRYGITPIRKDYSYLDINQVKSDVNQGTFLVTIEYKFNSNKE